MKYVATVEIEFTTPSEAIDPLGMLKAILARTTLHGPSHLVVGPVVDHYHIIEQPRQLRKPK